MTSQFVEYADVDRPCVKLVSCKQIRVFLTDTSIGIVLYSLVHAISPNLITKAPQFRLSVTLGTSNASDSMEYLSISPSQKDYPFGSYITYPDDIKETVAKSLDQVDTFPIKQMQGSMYFHIAKKGSQRIMATCLEIL
jgi:hypothetical protein